MFWLAFHGLLSVLSYRIRAHPPAQGMAPPSVGWAFSHQSLIKETPPQTCPQAFFSNEVLSSKMTLFYYHIDKKKKKNTH